MSRLCFASLYGPRVSLHAATSMMAPQFRCGARVLGIAKPMAVIIYSYRMPRGTAWGLFPTTWMCAFDMAPIWAHACLARESRTMTFDSACVRRIGHEGKFTDNPKDDGNWTGGKQGRGELKGTKYGIAAKSYPHLDIKNLTLDEATAIGRLLGCHWPSPRRGQVPAVRRRGEPWARQRCADPAACGARGG